VGDLKIKKREGYIPKEPWGGWGGKRTCKIPGVVQSSLEKGGGQKKKKKTDVRI